MDNFLFATASRTGYRSLKSQLLQHTKSPEAESELRGHRKTLEVYVPLHVVALDEQHARHPVALTISSRSVWRIPHSDLLFYPYTMCKNCQTVTLLREVHFVSSERTFCHLILPDEAHFELSGCLNKKTRGTGVKLIQINCICNHFTSATTSQSQSIGIVWDISIRYQWSLFFFILFEYSYCNLCPYVHLVNAFLLPE
jgi:hypothetical protein